MGTRDERPAQGKTDVHIGPMTNQHIEAFAVQWIMIRNCNGAHIFKERVATVDNFYQTSLVSNTSNGTFCTPGVSYHILQIKMSVREVIK